MSFSEGKQAYFHYNLQYVLRHIHLQLLIVWVTGVCPWCSRYNYSFYLCLCTQILILVINILEKHLQFGHNKWESLKKYSFTVNLIEQFCSKEKRLRLKLVTFTYVTCASFFYIKVIIRKDKDSEPLSKLLL